MEKSAEAFRTISEVADWLGVQAHVLRFWESRFTQVKPVKRAGGRRYYRPSDMALLGGIRKLLHDDGMTIRGVQKILRNEGVRHVALLSPPIDEASEAAEQDEPPQRHLPGRAGPPPRPLPAAPSARSGPTAFETALDVAMQLAETAERQAAAAEIRALAGGLGDPGGADGDDMNRPPFPLRDPKAARARLAAAPAQSAALYARLIDLRDRMGTRAR